MNEINNFYNYLSNIDRSFLAIVGLYLDVLGAFFLAKGFLIKSIKEITKESGTFYGHNSFLSNSLIRQKWDVIFGFSLIGMGFLFQLAYYLISTHLIIFLLTLLIVVLLGIIVEKIIKIITMNNIEKKENTILDIEVEKIKPTDTKSLEHWGAVLKLSRNENESNEEYHNRMKAYLKSKPRFKRKDIFYLREYTED